MTWNSRVRLWAAAASLLAPAVPAAAEAPLPAVQRDAPLTLRAVSPRPDSERVRLVDVRILDVRADDRRLRLLAGSGRDFQAPEGLIVAARVATPFTGLDRTASPVIVIDGRPVDSIVDKETRQIVYAMIPSWADSARPASMQVGWLGDFERTLSNPVRILLSARPSRRR